MSSFNPSITAHCCDTRIQKYRAILGDATNKKSENEIQIKHILLPFANSIKKAEISLSPARLEICKCIAAIEKVLSSISIQSLNEIASSIKLDRLEGLNREAAAHTLALIKELQDPEYRATDAEKTEQLAWNLGLTLQTLKKETFVEDAKTQALAQRVLNRESYEIRKRASNGHSPAFFLVDKSTQKPFAILKQSKPEFCSSFSSHLPDMPLPATVWEHELISYEQGLLFGSHVPATLAVSFMNETKENVRGTIQEYIADSKCASEMFNCEGAHLLQSISKEHLHQVAFSGMFKGISAGHISNYILKVDPQPKSSAKIYEIDQEELLLPYNRLSEKIKLKGNFPTDAERQMAYRSLILCRMWILGLSQCGLPFSRATLMTITHPGFLPLLKTYQESALKYSDISLESWTAQQERLEMMQKICKEELAKDTIFLTPRDLYFAIFGGAHLWQIAQEKKYPAIIAWNQLISDPYQHILKDFGNPSTIPPCTLLEKPRDLTAESQERFNCFRILEGLEIIKPLQKSASSTIL